jgi:hypothetical protein
MNDDLENNLRDSLDRHAAGAAGASEHLGDVYARVDRRHRRRRSVAVIASVAVLAGGVAGFAVFAAGNNDDGVLQSAASPSSADVEQVPTTTVVYPAGANWACTGHVGSDGANELYSDCVPLMGGAGMPQCYVDATNVTTTMMPTTIPGSGDVGSAVGGIGVGCSISVSGTACVFEAGAPESTTTTSVDTSMPVVPPGCALPGLQTTCVFSDGAPGSTANSDPSTAVVSSSCPPPVLGGTCVYVGGATPVPTTISDPPQPDGSPTCAFTETVTANTPPTAPTTTTP